MKKQIMKLLKDESGQGMTEYILILVIVIAIATAFRDPIVKAIRDQVDNVSGKLGAFGTN